MEDKKTLTISMDTAICAARHIVGAHESACRGEPVDYAGICGNVYHLAECNAPCRRNWAMCNNVLDWQEMLEPIFAATGIYPMLMRDNSEPVDDPPNQP